MGAGRAAVRARGDTVELHPVYEQQAVRIELFGDQVERIRRFDALTGALLNLNITGSKGLALNDAWAAGPRTYLGLQTPGFPNLFMITGPGSPSVLANMVVGVEQHTEWIGACLTYLGDHGYQTIEPTLEAQDAWVDHVNEVAQGDVQHTAPSCNSWYLGANIPGGKPSQASSR